VTLVSVTKLFNKTKKQQQQKKCLEKQKVAAETQNNSLAEFKSGIAFQFLPATGKRKRERIKNDRKLK